MEEPTKNPKEIKHFSLPTIIAFALIFFGIMVFMLPFRLDLFKPTEYTIFGGLFLIFIGMVFGLISIIESRGNPKEDSLFAKLLIFFGGAFIFIVIAIVIIIALLVMYFITRALG